jgi:hypothetical protein
MWVLLLRNRRYRDAEALAAWMAERGISRRNALRRKLGWSLHRRAASMAPSLVEML